MTEVLTLADLRRDALARLLERYRVELVDVAGGAPIPGSHWGAPEAGLIGKRLYARADTPLHSILHELAHIVCMSADRRAGLDTDAGGDDLEECAVCYLQVLLAEQLPGFGRDRCLADMDAWGYSFREGSARNWFEGDGRDARVWLETHGLIEGAAVTWQLRAS
ncbi:MAG: hypothetical protein R3305_08410 [Gammaproteobacteria bacterium]|nr:hypothetical protein [Gammaproteobacteria bacterium]